MHSGNFSHIPPTSTSRAPLPAYSHSAFGDCPPPPPPLTLQASSPVSLPVMSLLVQGLACLVWRWDLRSHRA